MSRFAKVYAGVFSAIWVGYGLISLIMGRPHSLSLLLFGIAFSIVIIPATWFSQWLMSKYRRVDAVSRDYFVKQSKGRK